MMLQKRRENEAAISSLSEWQLSVNEAFLVRVQGSSEYALLIRVNRLHLRQR